MGSHSSLFAVKAILEPIGRGKFQVRYDSFANDNVGEAIEGPAGRIELKKFMKRLKESGYQTFNTKKGGRIVEVENW